MTTSYNGWPASPDPKAIGINRDAVARGTTVHFPPGLKGGDVALVLGYVAGELHRRVEPAGEGCWGYAYRQNRNAGNLSCHASGTAFDWNAPRHPNGKKGTWTPAQIKTVRAILAEVEGAVKWGEDFHGTTDGMHFEVCVSATALRGVASRLTQRLAAPPAAAVKARPATTPATPGWWTRELFRGSEGHDVLVARHNLHLPLTNGEADQVWDVALERAVRSVQSRAKIKINGRVDAATARAIG